MGSDQKKILKLFFGRISLIFALKCVLRLQECFLKKKKFSPLRFCVCVHICSHFLVLESDERLIVHISLLRPWIQIVILYKGTNWLKLWRNSQGRSKLLYDQHETHKGEVTYYTTNTFMVSPRRHIQNYVILRQLWLTFIITYANLR